MDHTDWTTTGALGDRYVLRSRVGSGRFTTVYSADDIRLERQVAVKLFHAQPDEDGLTRFAEEARVLGGLSHPGLVTVFDVRLDNDQPYIVMRLVDGGPLSRRIHNEGLEPAAVARLGAQLADVLAYVHERGVVHGDLDASNVLVDEQGTGHLTGFGADRGLGKPSGDVYALGMTLAECLPFDLGPEWRTVLTAMTDRDPDARPDAIRCGEVLRNIASGETNAFPLPDLEADLDAAEPSPARAEPAAKRTRPAYAGLAGMALGITALAVVVATATTGSPGAPAGEQRQPPAEQPAEESQAKPPGQTYPPAAAQRPDPTSPKPKPSPGKSSPATSPPPTTTTPPQDGDDEDEDEGPGNGNGNGNGNGRGKGLLGGILDGLG